MSIILTVQMATAACFAGPLFNMLVGLGIALLMKSIAIYPSQFKAELSLKIYVGFLTLFLSLASSLLVIPLSKFKIKKWYGIYLLLLNILFR